MLHASGLISKKIARKTLPRHRPVDRIKEFMGVDFFNGNFNKNPQLSHECLNKKQLFPLLTG